VPVQSYTNAIQLNPLLEWAYVDRAGAYLKQGEYNRAIADCNKAIEVNPKRAEAYVDRASAYLYMGEYNMAIVDYNRAIEINPELAEVYYNRSFAYQEQGYINQAKADLEKCITLTNDPQLIEMVRQAIQKLPSVVEKRKGQLQSYRQGLTPRLAGLHFPLISTWEAKQ
jgi:tetratricopeptide (TPR) repeat protein